MNHNSVIQVPIYNLQEFCANGRIMAVGMKLFGSIENVLYAQKVLYKNDVPFPALTKFISNGVNGMFYNAGRTM